MDQRQFEAHCECGASWNLVSPTDEEPEDVECLVCGATVVDLRDIGALHSAGRDVED